MQPPTDTLQCHCSDDKGDGQTWGMGATAVAATGVYLDRTERVRSLMAERGVDVLLLSVGHDLPYLTGYLAMPLERLTMLVLPRTPTPRCSCPNSRRHGSSSSRACSRCTRGAS